MLEGCEETDFKYVCIESWLWHCVIWHCHMTVCRQWLYVPFVPGCIFHIGFRALIRVKITEFTYLFSWWLW